MQLKPLIIIGGGGHASVLAEILLARQREIIGIVAPEINGNRRIFDGIRQFSSDDDVLKFNAADVLLVNGIGAVPGSSLRQDIDSKFRLKGYLFESVIDSTARISNYSFLGDGVQVMASASIQTGSVITRGAIINTAAVVEHDTYVGEHTHIAPGAVLAGGVSVGKNSLVGANSVVIEGISIGSRVIIGAGVTVRENVRSEVRYFGKSKARSLSSGEGS